MSASNYSLNLNALEKGIHRKLVGSMDAHIFPVEQGMRSLVFIAPNAIGTIHSYPQEQWIILIAGGVTRLHYGEHIPLGKGAFRIAKSNCEHGIIVARRSPDCGYVCTSTPSIHIQSQEDFVVRVKD